MKIRPVGTELLHADGWTGRQTDMTMIIHFATLGRRLKPSQLMLYKEIIAVCSQFHTKHINTLCGQNVELLNVKLVVHLVTTGL